MNKDLIGQILDTVFSFLSKKAAAAPQAQAPAPVVVAPAHVATPATAPAPISAPAQIPISGEIDWTDPKARITKNFSVGEALLLPSWGVMHVPSEEEKVAILEIGQRVTKAIAKLEELLGKPLHVNIHAWMRPDKANCPGSKWDGQSYNRYIYETQVWADLTEAEKALKHVPNSPHISGKAIDLHVINFEGKEGCEKIRALILPYLEELNIRMEHLPNGGSWVHFDSMPVKVNRYFSP